MGVHDRLADRRSVVKPDIEAVWRKSRQKLLANPTHQFPYGTLFGRGEFVERGDVPPRNDECVPFGDGEPVEKCNGVLRLH